MELLKGSETAKELTREIKETVGTLERRPHLVIIRVGENPSDLSYEAGALKRMEKCDIDATVKVFPEDVTPEDFLSGFNEVNEDPQVDGILIFRPLKKELEALHIEELLDPDKDVDCISPKNVEGVFSGRETVYPCTAQAVMEMMHHHQIALSGKRVAVIGRSMVIGKPVAMMCLSENATVTICHSRTENLPEVTKEADIVIAAVGRAEMVDHTYLKEDAIVFDVGINVNEEGKLVGDVNREKASEKASLLTPVPGGVGAVTTSVLALHVLQNYQKKVKKNG